MTKFVLTAFAVAAFAAVACADGVVVPQRAVVKPARTPDQRALLRFDGTTETLVIETTVQGEGRDFAWILPLPAAPKIEASTTGLFPTLERVSAPEIVDEWVEERRNGPDVGWIYVVALGLGVWTAVRWRRSLPLVVTLSATPLLLALTWVGCGVGGPRHYKAGGSTPQAVTVLSHQQVGVFDTATLDVRDPAALRTWLDANGFRAPDGIDDVVDEYVKEGWIFVASKIRRDGDDSAADPDAEVRRVHPLAFTFAAKEAVYPMRLTGAANDSVALDLFVVGDRRAEAPGLSVEFCGDGMMSLRPDAVAELAETQYMSDVEEHGELWRRCAGTRVLTKLAGVLDRAAMAHDVAVQWTDFEAKQITYVTPDVAWRRARLPGAWALAASLLVAAFICGRRARRIGRWATGHDLLWPAEALVAAAVATSIAWSAAPRVPTDAKMEDWSDSRLPDDAERPPPAVCGDAAAVRAWMTSITRGLTNGATGEPMREEDSPGNWYLHEDGGRIELVVFGSFKSSWEHRAIDVSRRVPLDGTVRAADGYSVSDASVRLTEARVAPVAGEFFTYTIRTQTDDRGRYHLDVPVGRRWHLSVVHDDHPYLVVRDIDLRDPAPAPTDLTLPRERTIRGRVVDAAGVPRAGVEVRACRESPFTTHENSCIATTAADGTFQFAGFDAEAPEIRVSMSVHEPKFQDHSELFLFGQNDPTRTVELRLRGE